MGAQPVELCSVLADHLVVAFAQLLVDGGQLLTQEVIALLLVDPFGDICADLCRHLQLGDVLPGPCTDQCDALLDVDGVKHHGTPLVVGLAPGGDSVGKRPGIGDGAQDLGKASALAQLRNLLQDHAQLADGSLHSRCGPCFGDQFDVGVVGATLAGVHRHEAGAALGLQDGCLLAVGQDGRVGNAGDDADVAGDASVGGGGEDHSAVAAACGLDCSAGSLVVQGDRDDCAGQHDLR